MPSSKPAAICASARPTACLLSLTGSAAAALEGTRAVRHSPSQISLIGRVPTVTRNAGGEEQRALVYTGSCSSAPRSGACSWSTRSRYSSALAQGDTRLSLSSTAQPLHTRFPIIFSTCFSKVTIGYHPRWTAEIAVLAQRAAVDEEEPPSHGPLSH